MKVFDYKKITTIMVILLSTIVFANNLNGQNRHKKNKEVVVKKQPHHKYRDFPKIGEVVKVMPSGSVSVNPGVVMYYYYGGIFYKPYAGSFIVVQPPKGTRVKVLPNNHTKIDLNGKSYYYYFGTFYCNDRLNDDYVITNPPIGAIVEALPKGYTTKSIDDKEYFIYEDAWYKQVDMRDGSVGYKVVGDN